MGQSIFLCPTFLAFLLASFPLVLTLSQWEKEKGLLLSFPTYILIGLLADCSHSLLALIRNGKAKERLVAGCWMGDGTGGIKWLLEGMVRRSRRRSGLVSTGKYWSSEYWSGLVSTGLVSTGLVL